MHDLDWPFALGSESESDGWADLGSRARPLDVLCDTVCEHFGVRSWPVGRRRLAGLLLRSLNFEPNCSDSSVGSILRCVLDERRKGTSFQSPDALRTFLESGW